LYTESGLDRASLQPKSDNQFIKQVILPHLCFAVPFWIVIIGYKFHLKLCIQYLAVQMYVS